MLDDQGFVPNTSKYFSVDHHIQTGSGPTEPPMYCIQGSQSRQSMRLKTHSSNAEINYKLHFTSTRTYIFMAWYVSKGQLYITITLQGIAHSKQSLCILYWNIVLIFFILKWWLFFLPGLVYWMCTTHFTSMWPECRMGYTFGPSNCSALQPPQQEVRSPVQCEGNQGALCIGHVWVSQPQPNMACYV